MPHIYTTRVTQNGIGRFFVVDSRGSVTAIHTKGKEKGKGNGKGMERERGRGGGGEGEGARKGKGRHTSFPSHL